MAWHTPGDLLGCSVGFALSAGAKSGTRGRPASRNSMPESFRRSTSGLAQLRMAPTARLRRGGWHVVDVDVADRHQRGPVVPVPVDLAPGPPQPQPALGRPRRSRGCCRTTAPDPLPAERRVGHLRGPGRRPARGPRRRRRTGRRSRTASTAAAGCGSASTPPAGRGCAAAPVAAREAGDLRDVAVVDVAGQERHRPRRPPALPGGHLDGHLGDRAEGLLEGAPVLEVGALAEPLAGTRSPACPRRPRPAPR